MFRKMIYVTISATLVLALASWASAQEHRGFLTLKTPAQAGSTTLPAGEYEVVHRVSPGGHYVEFSRITESSYGYIGAPIHREVQAVAAVACTPQPLTSKAAETVAQTDGARIVRLEIQGESVAYAFQ